MQKFRIVCNALLTESIFFNVNIYHIIGMLYIFHFFVHLICFKTFDILILLDFGHPCRIPLFISHVLKIHPLYFSLKICFLYKNFYSVYKIFFKIKFFQSSEYLFLFVLFFCFSGQQQRLKPKGKF